MRFAWLEFVGAFRNITRQYRRSIFGLSAVSFGVIALLLATGFIEWIFWATREGTIQTGLGHIHAMRPGYLKNGHADPFRYLLPPDEQQMEEVARFPMVRTLGPRLAFNGLIGHGDATISFIGEGVDPKAEEDISRALPISSGRNLSSDDPNGIILGRGLAQNLGVKVGDQVVLVATTATRGINAVECTVRGLFTTVSKAYDDSALRAPLPVAQKLMRVSGSHRWIIVLEDTKHAPDVLLKLRQRFGQGGIEFVPWYDMADFYTKTVTLLSRQIDVVKFIIAVIIVLSISNTMIMNVLERTAEIGTSLAIGRRRRQILRQFVYEGLTIGLIGGVLGVITGGLLATVLSIIGIPMPPPPGMSEGYSGKILINSGLILNAVVLALGATLLASFYPAWKASRMEIVDALRHNR